ncbi:amino acid aminotransferase [Novosphingopyxis sp. YJ-S2-01]|uniref:amino acid aminotransferase n=1 Tax=Novosphingopyxis sp. YJ-S2-01 TaxID=2794021 RepID=UPI0018DDF63E|nr:amino acid aminotransferase [Novosphingopyxis sp. YJ-S2-01]MBH9536700.1 aspartate/tyrosine/aromatic aminotransferase [Novosphingopyxis sp. YJ-S2-01]
MFEDLKDLPPDGLLQLIKLYRDDSNPQKIDLGVGVYRDADGGTPVFRAVKKAEHRLHEVQDSKSYLGPEGDHEFVAALRPYIFGKNDGYGARLNGVQTPGGTGAVRLACETLASAGAKRVLLGTPSWPNHGPIIQATGMEPVLFDHADIKTQTLDFGALIDAMKAADKGDIVLLHGCCHNPTGIDYSADQWGEIASIVADRGLFPLIDLAYQGLGHGFEEDAEGLRKVIAAAPESMLAYSCDKNFGLYRERVGALYALSNTEAQAATLYSHLLSNARANWSMPPDHGAATVRVILSDDDFRAEWDAEVRDMRARLNRMRSALAEYQNVGDVDLAAVGRQNGLFSTLNLSKDQVMAMRGSHGIYMAASGRINVAGLNERNIPHFVEALRSIA